MKVIEKPKIQNWPDVVELKVNGVPVMRDL
jgi:hypothetical protein